ncbi:MAG TPA: bifunctional nuclease domain-containing protein [Spirochaetia bacterium]|nr:bifunctional nuclease domain-containing protein [Spirochaetia bacterium]
MSCRVCELDIKAIVLHRKTLEPTAVLQDVTGLRMVTVPVDTALAGALIIGVEQPESEFPLDHSLVVRLFDQHGFIAEALLLTMAESGLIGAVLRYRAGRRRYELVVTPGDGMLLSIRFSVPIYMKPADLDRCSSSGLPDSIDLFSQDVLLLDSISPPRS